MAKLELIACVYWSDGTFERPWKVVAPDQFGVLIEKLLELKSICRSLAVAMESSGTYGDALRQACLDANIAVHRVSAKAVKDHAETFDGVPSQHDGKDAAIIGALCVMGKSVPWPWAAASETDSAMRYWVRKLDRAQRVMQMHVGKLEGELARHWPEVTALLSFSGRTLSAALLEWGSPAALASDPQAQEKLRRMGGHFLKQEKIDAVIACAKQSQGVRMDEWSMQEVRDLAQMILDQRKQIKECRLKLEQLCVGNTAIQMQSAAVGVVTACVLWVCLGDVNRYHCAAAYRKAMGLNLREYSSGQLKGRLSISKRGKRMTRRWLYFAAMRMMSNASVKKWTDKKKERDGGSGAKAVTAVMRRLAMALYNVGKHGEVFDPARLFPGAKKRRGSARANEASK